MDEVSKKPLNKTITRQYEWKFSQNNATITPDMNLPQSIQSLIKRLTLKNTTCVFILITIINLYPTASAWAAAPSSNIPILPPTSVSQNAVIPPSANLSIKKSLSSAVPYNMAPLAKKQSINVLVDGYYETKISKRDYTPKDLTSPIFDTIQNDPVYKELPRDVLLGDPKLETRYKINIEGRMNDRLSIYWDADQQEPDFPGKYDIRVKYDNSELAFGDVQADFQNGEFIQVKRALNGVKFTSYDKDWQGIVAIGKQRSEPKKFETNGNGGRKIKLANKSVLEGSVTVYVDNKVKAEGKDYTVNYYDGEINFTDPVQRENYIKVIYEFTNPVEDFVPIPNRRNFLGAQYFYAPIQKEIPQFVTASCTENITVSTNMIDDLTGSVIFFVKNTPVIPGSEIVLRNNRYLRKDKMYQFKPQNGRVAFSKTQAQPGDEISISYEYYITRKTTQTIATTGTRGPYYLDHKNILKGSLTCTFNQETLVEDRDYLLDPIEGKLTFKYDVDFPKDILLSYAYSETKTATVNKQTAPMAIGVTYLDESINQTIEPLTTAVFNETPSVNGTDIFVQNTPLDPSSSVTLLVNNATVNIVAIDYYHGKLTLATPITASNVLVSYTYKKAYLSEVIFQGKDGYQVYNSGSDFSLPKTPAQYKGVYQVTLWGGSDYPKEYTLINGREYEITYANDGQSFQIRFMDSRSNRLSTLKSFPDKNVRIRIKYYYSPDISPNIGNVMQKMAGVTVRTAINENWSVSAEYVKETHNFSKPSTEGSDSSPTRLDSTTFQIKNKNLVEHSEQVFVNNILMTQDTDYWMNYELGQIKLINLTPGPSDNVSVLYKYYATGSTEAGVEQNANAIKLASQYQLGDITFFGDVKVIDKNFMPIGELAETRGTTGIGGGLLWTLNRKENVFFDYHNRYVYVSPNQAGNKDIYLVKTDIASRMNLFLWDTVDFKQEFLYNTQIQDSSIMNPTTNRHEIDRLKWSYSPEISFGPDYAVTTLLGQFSQESNDFLDREHLEDQYNRGVGLKLNLTLPKSSSISKLTFNPYMFYRANTTAKPDNTPTATDIISNYGFTNEFIPIDMIKTKTGMDIKNVRKGLDGSQDVMNNNYIQIGVTPFDWIDAGFDYNHSEAESPLILQKGKIEDRTTYSLRQYQPYGMLQTLKYEKEWWALPLKGSRLATKWSTNSSAENNGKKLFYRNADTYEYRSFQPIPGLTFNRLGWDRNNSFSTSNVQTSSVSSNIATTTYRKLDADITIQPKLLILDLFTYNIKLSDKIETRFNFDQALIATDNTINRNIPEFSRNHKLGFSPGNLVLPWNRLDFGKFSAAVGEDWTDNKDQTETNASSNANGTRTWTTTRDNKNTRMITYETAYSPFNLGDISGVYRDGFGYYNRDINTTLPGTLYKLTKDWELKGTYSPYKFLALTANLEKNHIDQWMNPKTDLQIETLQNMFTEKLIINRLKKAGEALITPIDFFSIKVGLQTFDINQNSVSASIAENIEIHQDVQILGGIIRPMTDMSFSADYLSKKVSQDNIDKGKSYGIIAKFQYNPKITTHFSVNIISSLEYNIGQDLNYLEMNNVLQGTQKVSTWKIIDRRDLQFYASLSADLEIPITNMQYIEKIIFSATGKIKRIVDYNNAQNSYDIMGLVISGKIVF